MTGFLMDINAGLTARPLFAIAFHFILCACLGSYFNLFAWRWPQIQERQWLSDIQEWFREKGWPTPVSGLDGAAPLTLFTPRSFCPGCGQPIPLYFNIPVLGWAMLRGKAACCGKPISIKYPLFELLCGLLGAFAWWHYRDISLAWPFLLLAMPLCMASQTDFESMMLPDSVTGFIIFTGLGLSIFGRTPIVPAAAFAGLAAGYLGLAAIRIGGSWAFKKEAMGQGDPKLFAALGAWIGLVQMPQALLLAALSALAYALIAKIIGKSAGPAIPFGPFLALGGLICYVWSPVLI